MAYRPYFPNDVFHTGSGIATVLMPNELRREKTGLWGFRPGPTQTELHKHRQWLEAGNSGFTK